MNYNQFYRKRDRYKRKITPSEKANAQRLGISFGKSILAGMAAGLLLIVLFKLLA